MKETSGELKEFNLNDIESAYNCLRLSRRADVMRYFIEYCFDNNLLFTLMGTFLIKNRIEDLDYLLKINSIKKVFNLNELKNDYNQTLFHIACKNGDYKLVSLLCSYDANFQIKDKFGLAPFHDAINESNKQAIKALIDSRGSCSDLISYSMDRNINIFNYINEIISKEEQSKDSTKIKNLVFQGKLFEYCYHLCIKSLN